MKPRGMSGITPRTWALVILAGLVGWAVIVFAAIGTFVIVHALLG